MTESLAKQAYLVMAHGDIRLLNALVSALDSPYCDIFLHIDAKSSLRREDVQRPRCSGLYFMEPMSVYWADYTQTECELRLLSYAMDNGEYDYFHLLSGADFPLRSQKSIASYFAGRDDIFLHYATRDNLEHCRPYVQYYHFFQRQLSSANRAHGFNMFKVLNAVALGVQSLIGIDRCKGYGYEPKKGANWFSIPLDFARYVICQGDVVRKRFRMTRSSDEFFMQTLVCESEVFKKRLYRFSEDDDYESCLRIIEWGEGAPHVYAGTDFERLVNSGRLFARKFDSSVDFEIIKRLMEYIKEDEG